MSALVSSRPGCARTRLVALGMIASVVVTALTVMWASARPAFADVQRFEIKASAVVGALPGAGLSPAVRLDPPEPAPVVDVPAASAAVVPAAATPAMVNQSNCRTDLANSVMSITIPDISYSCPVYAGGQNMLNAGAVTQISDDAIASVLADHPGGPGLLWIAGHRSSHGAAFAAVPNLADGALITVSDGTNTATYRIVGRQYVAIRNDRVIDVNGNATGAATLNSIIRPDHGGNRASRLLLQTCDGASNRWMIYADLVTA